MYKALVAILVAFILLIPAGAFAYSKSSSTEPIDFTLSQGDFSGGSCANGNYGAIQVRFDGQSAGYGSITSWSLSDGSSDLTWDDVTLSSGFGLEYDPHPTTTVDTIELFAICNASADYDYGWNSNSVDSSGWTWTAVSSTEEESTASSTVEAIEELHDTVASLGYILVIIMGIGLGIMVMNK